MASHSHVRLGLSWSGIQIANLSEVAIAIDPFNMVYV